eukprot:augustus_masked-scaffold_95-processed-gene-0.34-mRNA-1 protein AED:1.00 eAED:1.00 QI:0/0/0/0/1/1/3/0/396
MGTNSSNKSKANVPTPTKSPQNSTFFIQSAPNPPLLKTLSAEDVISFTHSYAHQSGNIPIQHYLDGKVIRELSDVYDAKTDKDIKEVLEQIVAEYDDEKREMNIRILRNQLKWPEDKPYRVQVKHFINGIKRLVTLKEMKDKRIEKQVLKIAISKLPARFEIDTDEYNQLHKLVRVTHTGLICLKVKYSDGKENELPRLKIALVDSPDSQWLKFEEKIKNLVNDYGEEDIVSLKNILLEKYEAFGDKESPARIWKLEPIFCYVIPEAVFPVDSSKNYGPTMLGYLRAKLESMEKRNLIRRSRNPKHGCQTFLVPKKGPEKYRMVTNMKPLSRFTIKTPLTMPNIEQQVFVPMGSSYYGAFDILSGFDYMPVHEDSMHYFTIITPIGAYETVGSPMG